MTRNLESDPEMIISQQIDSQLAEGHRLLALDIRTPKELQRAAARRSIWVETNVALLNNCPVSEVTKGKLLPQVSLDSIDTGDDFESQLQAFYDITKTQMSVLADVHALVPKSPTSGHDANKDEVNTQTASSSLSSLRNRLTAEAKPNFKERLEQHPIGAAAILCFACITGVFLVISWYHNENEKTLINRYEMQINGMKNEFDAKQRNYEEIIRKLKEEMAQAQPPDKNKVTR